MRSPVRDGVRTTTRRLLVVILLAVGALIVISPDHPTNARWSSATADVPPLGRFYDGDAVVPPSAWSSGRALVMSFKPREDRLGLGTLPGDPLSSTPSVWLAALGAVLLLQVSWTSDVGPRRARPLRGPPIRLPYT